MNRDCRDYVIIGGGIIGTTVALELARRRVGSIIILEKENRLGMHASGRNSGVIHSGINQKPGTLKARMCVEGSRLLRDYCKLKKIPMTECGTLVVARNSREQATLEQIFSLGVQCGVPDLSMITDHELTNREPAAAGKSALLSPTGAVVDAHRLLASLAADAQSLGVDYSFSEKVLDIGDPYVRTSCRELGFGHLINCAGLEADFIAHRMSIGKQYRIIPFRGEYMEVSACPVRGMIYQPPDLRFPFLSIHLTRETNGAVLAGPSAVFSFGRESYDKQWHWRQMCETFSSRQFLAMLRRPEFLMLAVSNAKTSLFRKFFIDEVQSLVRLKLSFDQFRPYRSGIRAQLVDDSGHMVNDLLVLKTKATTHVLNAVSPGLTCSLAFSRHLADQITNPTTLSVTS